VMVYDLYIMIPAAATVACLCTHFFSYVYHLGIQLNITS